MAKKLTVRQKKALLSAHILFSVALLGSAFCSLALSIAAAVTDDGAVLRAAYLGMGMLQERVVRVGALGTAVSGVLLSVLTHWGLTRFYWIIVKEVGTVLSIGLGIVAMGTWTRQAIALTTAHGLEAVSNPAYIVNQRMLLAGIAVQIVSLSALVVISVFKPWGQRSRHRQRRSDGQRAGVQSRKEPSSSGAGQ